MIEKDAAVLRRALALAKNGLFTSSPNPRVGCVIRRNGKTIGEGWHRRAGEAHAEVIAMQNCGSDLQDAEMFVSMEPCAHEGKTPSCAAMLAKAKPARVVVAMPDPNPQVAGQGLAMLQKAGIKTVCAEKTDKVFARALDMNIGFASRMIRQRPWVRLKIAATADGKTALSSGLSQWISGEESRKDAHYLRARSCAMITGVGTALADNPQLTVRHVSCSRQPLRVLIDGSLRASADLRMFSGGAIVACAVPARHIADDVEVLSLPDSDGKVDLAALLNELAMRGVNEVTVEAGRRLCGAFVNAGLADEMVVYHAPLFFGGGFDMMQLPPPSSPQQATRWRLVQCERMDEDAKLVYESPDSRQILSDALATIVT